jgi:hypothetical protein
MQRLLLQPCGIGSGIACTVRQLSYKQSRQVSAGPGNQLPLQRAAGPSLQTPITHLSCKHAQGSSCTSSFSKASVWQDADQLPLQC